MNDNDAKIIKLLRFLDGPQHSVTDIIVGLFMGIEMQSNHPEYATRLVEVARSTSHPDIFPEANSAIEDLMESNPLD